MRARFIASGLFGRCVPECHIDFILLIFVLIHPYVVVEQQRQEDLKPAATQGASSLYGPFPKRDFGRKRQNFRKFNKRQSKKVLPGKTSMFSLVHTFRNSTVPAGLKPRAD